MEKRTESQLNDIDSIRHDDLRTRRRVFSVGCARTVQAPRALKHQQPAEGERNDLEATKYFHDSAEERLRLEWVVENPSPVRLANGDRLGVGHDNGFGKNSGKFVICEPGVRE